MEHLLLKASTTIVDQELGQFDALVSAWDADREHDTIAPTAFDKTIAAWQASGKALPLLFEHTTEAVGHIDPNTMRPTREGLVAAGEVDRSTDTAPSYGARSRPVARVSASALRATPRRSGAGACAGPTSTCSRSPPRAHRCIRRLAP